VGRLPQNSPEASSSDCFVRDCLYPAKKITEGI
jgi:hypothetical protein